MQRVCPADRDTAWINRFGKFAGSGDARREAGDAADCMGFALYAAEPNLLIEHLKNDEAIAEAGTLLLTIPNQLGVGYNAHVMEAILSTVAPALGWH